MLAEARWRICRQSDKGPPEALQTSPGAREARMMAVHDADVARYELDRRREGADILGNDNPALSDCGLEDARIVHPAKPWPMRRQCDGVDPVGHQVISKPARIVLIK